MGKGEIHPTHPNFKAIFRYHAVIDDGEGKAGRDKKRESKKKRKKDLAQSLMPLTLVTAKHGEGLAGGQESYLPDLELE